MTIDPTVADLLAKARTAQALYEKFNQAEVDDVVAAIAWVVLEPDRNQHLSERAVEDTGLGDIDDKFTKNHRKTLGLLRDLTGAPSVGVIATDSERGLIEIARPIGVVGAITPSTNPVATRLKHHPRNRSNNIVDLSLIKFCVERLSRPCSGKQIGHSGIDCHRVTLISYEKRHLLCAAKRH